MSRPVDMVPVQLTCADEKAGRKQMREMLGKNWWRNRGKAVWAGFAAEHALVRAWDCDLPGLRLSPVLTHDLELDRDPLPPITVEVKTRAVGRGWTDPSRFEWVVIPSHDGREPIKDVDLVWFCWYSCDEPRRLWVLGYVRGREEFRRRSTYYKEGEPLPRGGWAGKGGAYAIEVKQLRPFPRRTFKEADK